MTEQWTKGRTGDDKVMFLDQDGRYCGHVQIEQMGGGAIAAADEDRRRACAERILKAVNCHDELVEALVDLISDAERQMANPSHHQPFSLNNARAAIAKATGEGAAS